jgi:hypothetical protein
LRGGPVNITKRREYSARTIGCLVLPEPLEPPRRKGGISGCALQIAMAEIMRKASGIVSIVGELIAGAVSQHMRVNLERHLRRYASSLEASGPKDGDTVQCCRPAWRGYDRYPPLSRYSSATFPGASTFREQTLPQGRRSQSPRLRRPPQGHARGHCDPHQRHHGLRPTSVSSSRT